MTKNHILPDRKEAQKKVSHLKQTADDELHSWQKQWTASGALRATTLGFVGGLRSTVPLTVLDWTRRQNPAPSNDIEKFLDSSLARVILNTLAAGELVGDKLPITPSRISPAPLLARLGVGAIVGMSIFRRTRQPLVLGAILGTAGAGVGTVAGYYVRNAISSSTKAPQWLLGLAEDALAFGLGFLAVKR